jgi:hypothetical protein
MTTATFTPHARETAIKGTDKFMTYDFNKVNKIAENASEEIETFLLSLPDTVKVVNVEKDRNYQSLDIDLLWYVRSRKTGKIIKKTVEIKGDRYYHTGNYFFETVSNTTKNTPGCFLITEADFVFYYFVDQKELHILPTEETRKWFLDNLHRFKEAKTSTSSSKGLLYTSLGRKVPRHIVRKHCGITVLDITPYI